MFLIEYLLLVNSLVTFNQFQAKCQIWVEKLFLCYCLKFTDRNLGGKDGMEAFILLHPQTYLGSLTSGPLHH